MPGCRKNALPSCWVYRRAHSNSGNRGDANPPERLKPCCELLSSIQRCYANWWRYTGNLLMKPSYADIVVGRSRQLRGAASHFRGYIWGYTENKYHLNPNLKGISEYYSLPAPAPYKTRTYTLIPFSLFVPLPTNCQR